MGRRLVLVVIAGLAMPTAAHAESWTVAGPTAGGLRLVVTDRDDTVCYTLREHDEEVEQSCAPTAPEPDEAAQFSAGVAGVTGTGVAAVDLEWPDTRRQRVETSDGAAYQGRLAGKVRFWLADPIEPRRPWLLRRYGADGALIDADTIGEDPVVVPRHTLARGRGWKLFTETHRQLDPVADELDRTIVQPETRIAERRQTFWFGQDPELQRALVGYVRTLPHHVRLLVGVRGPGVEHVDIVYGSGRRVRTRVRGDTLWRTIPPREAVVAIEARDAAGEVIARTQPRVPPLTVPTVGAESSPFDTPLPEPDAPLLPFGGGLAALQEVGPWVCLQVGGWFGDEDQFPCSYAPLGPEDQLMIAGPHGDDDVVIAGLVHRDIARVRIKSVFSKHSQTLPTEPARGRWAPYARVFTASTRNDLATIHLLDVRGKQRGPDWAAPIWGEVDSDPLPRVLGGAVGTDRFCTELGEVESCSRINVLASCRADRVAVTVRVRKRPAVRVVTSDGHVHRARKAKGWWIYVAPRRLGVRAVRWRGGRRRLGRVPPAARECGYAAAPR